MSSKLGQGVFVATVTFFDKAGKLSLPRLEAHLERLADAGVDGFVPCGTTGEAATLEAAEQREVISVAVTVARRRKLKVIAGCGGNDTKKVVALVAEAATLQCDGALVVTPYYNKPTAAGLLAHYRAVADDGGLPVFLYNVPGRTNVNLLPPTVAELFAHRNIVGIKEASGNYGQWLQLATLVNLAEKAVVAGDDDALTVLQALGGCGIISASANLAPELFVSLYRLGAEGKWDEAFSLQKKLFPLIRALFSETSPSPLKYALEQQGHGDNIVRLPLVPISAATEEVVRSAMQALELER
jgi:4-hydroxy-tetrahydrodipicolinate synthase